ncbi:MAG TPA: Fic family protein [Desulfobacterales bacterium]|nr:Fic family protein [Desulfobacterales bacterium]
MSVIKVSIFKSGFFTFSSKFSLRELQALRVEARVLYDTIKDLPILPEIASQLEQDLIRRSIFSTAAIEGNPLSEEKVSNVLEEKNVNIYKKQENAEIEIKNLEKAYKIIKAIKPTGNKPIINESLIKFIHKKITLNVRDEYNNPGNYRNHIVKVGDKNHGGVYTPPKCLEDIRTLMKNYTKWINSDDVLKLDPPIIRAALAHYFLGLIHPFGNGNGRTARIIEAYILQNEGIKFVPTMLSNYYYKNMDDYFWAFSNTIKSKDNNVTPFLKFVLKGFIESLKEIKERIVYFIRIFSLRDYYAHLKKKKRITQRQHDLMLLLLNYHKPFSLKDLFDQSPLMVLYRRVSERTAFRDLKKLQELNLLTVEGKKYRLNIRALE